MKIYSMPNADMPRYGRVSIGTVSVQDITVPELLTEIQDHITTGQRLIVLNVNAHAIRMAQRQPAFSTCLSSADIVFCDGFGVMLAARVLGHRLRQRMTPPDWLLDLVAAVSAVGGTFFLLGDEADVVRGAGAYMTSNLSAEIAGVHHGFFSPHGAENAEIVRTIRVSGASVVLVGMGMPRQEEWILQNASRAGAVVYLSVGALFRWTAGVERRGPAWLTSNGLEWATRLVRHPIRHFNRYVLGLPEFAFLIGRQWLRERCRPVR